MRTVQLYSWLWFNRENSIKMKLAVFAIAVFLCICFVASDENWGNVDGRLVSLKKVTKTSKVSEIQNVTFTFTSDVSS